MTVDQNQQMQAGENPVSAVVDPVEKIDTAPKESRIEAPLVVPSAESESGISNHTAESASVGTEIGTAQTPSPTVQDDIVPQVQASSIGEDDQAAPTSAQPVPSPVVDDTAAFAGDDVYLKEADRVMREDAEKPYEEEEDLETIQKDYLEKRFDFKVGKDQE